MTQPRVADPSAAPAPRAAGSPRLVTPAASNGPVAEDVAPAPVLFAEPFDAVVDAADGAEEAGAARNGRHVVRGSMWYIAAIGVGAALSFLFWALAAKLAPPETVGVSSALWSSIQFWNFVSGMGLPVAVARYGSARLQTVHVLFFWGLVYTAVTSAAVTMMFGIAAPQLVRNQGVIDALFQWGIGPGLVVFFLLITGMSFALLVEVRLVTLRRFGWVFARVLAISLIRLPFLFVPAIARNPLALLLLIAGPPALSGFTGILIIHRSTPKRLRDPLLPLPPETWPAFKYASVNYVGMLAAQAPQFTLPIILIGEVSAAEFAAFFMAWQITIVVFLVPHTVGQVVLAEGSRSASAVNQQVRHGLFLSLGLMAAATLATLAGSSLVTKVFGPDYALTAALLPRLVGAGIPWAITCMCLAKARVEGNHPRTVMITVGFAVFTLVPAAIMSARTGAAGTATAWLLGNLVAAALAVAVTRVVRPGNRAEVVVSSAQVA